jgi:integrase/recombinase XerD
MDFAELERAAATPPAHPTELDRWVFQVARWAISHTSRNTRESYGRVAERWTHWCLARDVDPWAVDRTHVDLWRDDLAGRLAASTVKHHLSALTSLYEWILDEEPSLLAVERNPAARVRKPKVANESTTPFLSLVQAHQVAAAAREAGPLEHAVVCLLLNEGLRVSEMCSADVGDYTTVRGHPVLRVTRKGGRVAETRLSVVVGLTRDALDVYLDGRQSGPLLLGPRTGRRLVRHTAAKIVQRVAGKAGVPRVTPHGLRHSCGTIMRDLQVPPMDIQAKLGHLRFETTERYIRSGMAVERDPTDRIGEALAG